MIAVLGLMTNGQLNIAIAAGLVLAGYGLVGAGVFLVATTIFWVVAEGFDPPTAGIALFSLAVAAAGFTVLGAGSRRAG